MRWSYLVQTLRRLNYARICCPVIARHDSIWRYANTKCRIETLTLYQLTAFSASFSPGSASISSRNFWMRDRTPDLRNIPTASEADPASRNLMARSMHGGSGSEPGHVDDDEVAASRPLPVAAAVNSGADLECGGVSSRRRPVPDTPGAVAGLPISPSLQPRDAPNTF